jgi:hypothetical protein
MRTLACILLLSLLGGPLFAQEPAPIAPTYQSTMFGVGGASVYDSYLSPLKYSGIAFSLMEERLNITRLWKGRLVGQHLFAIELADTRNPSGTGQSYAGHLNYDYGLYYPFRPLPNLQLFAGLQGDLLLGAIYNLRNTNNPANAQFGIHLNLSAMAAYSFRIGRQPFRVRYQIQSPVVGAFFSPGFGQSYYEIGLNDGNAVMHLAAWPRHFVLRNLLTVEVPINRYALRVSGSSRLYQTQVNGLKTQVLSQMVFVGFARYFHLLPEKRKNPNHYRYVFD